jgi:ArsR family transcriptional regulator
LPSSAASARRSGLVDAERRGTWVYDRARPAILRQLAFLLAVEPAGS